MRILVAYASEHGSTAQIAQVITEVLQRNALEATLKRIDDVKSIREYDAVVVGSAIYMGHWLPQAKKFLYANALELAAIPVWVFSSGPTGKGSTLDLLNGAIVPPDLRRIIDEIAPLDIVVFKGRLDLRRVTKAEKAILKAIGVPSGDYRDWKRIRAWAQNVALKLATLQQKQQVAAH